MLAHFKLCFVDYFDAQPGTHGIDNVGAICIFFQQGGEKQPNSMIDVVQLMPPDYHVAIVDD